MARLSASEPLAVNTISSGWAPMSRATWPRAAVSACAGLALYRWLLDGLPKWALRYGSIASTTRGSVGVVAL
jgi:hypothetical protein